MYGREFHVTLVADLIIATDDTYPDYLPQESILEDSDLWALASELEHRYPQDVKSHTWMALGIKETVDSLIESDNPYMRDFLSNYSFTESDRMEIVERVAKRICEKLRPHVDLQYQIRYKVMPNGRVGFRLE